MCAPSPSTASAQDDDGAAYVAYSSEGNKVMHMARLAPNLDNVAPGFERALVGQSRESPVIFKHAGVYFLFTSGCTGWEPNRAEVFYSRCGAPSGGLPAVARAARRSRSSSSMQACSSAHFTPHWPSVLLQRGLLTELHRICVRMV